VLPVNVSRKALFVLSSILWIVAAAPSIGQTKDVPNNQSSGLEEIVVTAERREENINKVPISITAFSQRTMDDFHIQTVGDLASAVPGLYLTPPQGSGGQDFNQIAIRGVISSSAAPTTQFYIDETPIAIRQFQNLINSGTPEPLIFDLDRVEVLRGPQGTLFGGSAMGGAIRYITPQPSLSDTTGFTKTEVSYTRGGDPSWEVGGAYGGPIIPGTVGFRASAWYQGRGGFIDQEDIVTGGITKRNANSASNYVLRPAITWSPAEDLWVTPAFYYQHKHSDNPDGYWENSLPAPENNEHVYGGIASPMTDELRLTSLAIKYTLGGLDFHSDTSYLDRRLQAINDYTQYANLAVGGVTFIPGEGNFHAYEIDMSDTQAFQQEFRIASQDPASRINWVAGAYFRRTDETLAQPLPPDLSPLTEAVAGVPSQTFFQIPNYIWNGQAVSAYTAVRATDVSKALFGDATVNLSSRLKATAGVRIDRTEVLEQRQFLAGPVDGTAGASATLPNQIGTPVTPRASVSYQYAENDIVYVSAAKGYRPGGGNQLPGASTACKTSLEQLGLTAVPPTFRSDSLWSYELGSKGFAWDKRIQFEASIYYIKWSNIQTVTGLASCQEGFTDNRGEAISKGGDLELTAVLTEGLKLHALAGYTDAYYPHSEYGTTSGMPDSPPPPLLIGAGDKFGGIRPWNYAVFLDYSRDVSALWPDSRSYARVDYRRLSSANSGDPRVATYDPLYATHLDQGYGILDLRLGITHGGWDMSAYVNNALNSDPLLTWGYTGSLYSASAIPPLSAGVTVWYRF
jgi:iron complex outermembrane receptor protein